MAIESSYSYVCAGKGKSLQFLNRFEEAIQAYDMALSIDTKTPAAREGKWFSLKKLHRYDEAFNLDSRNSDQNNLTAWICKGNMLLEIKLYEEAVHAFNRALIFDSANEPALRGRKTAEDALKTAR